MCCCENKKEGAFTVGIRISTPSHLGRNGHLSYHTSVQLGHIAKDKLYVR